MVAARVRCGAHPRVYGDREMTWNAAALPIVVAFGTVFVPGLAIAAAARLRGLTALALAGPLGFAAIGVAGVASAALHVRFGWWSVAVTAAVVVIVIVGARVLLTGVGRQLPAWDTWQPVVVLPGVADTTITNTIIIT